MKDIPGYEGRYAVTRDGRIWSYPKQIQPWRYTPGAFLKPMIDALGYSVVHLSDTNKKVRTFKVHRAVALAYIPNPLNLREVNHKSGVKGENSESNLEWSTRQNNVAHAYRLGLRIPVRLLGSSNRMTKIADKDIPEIRASNLPVKELALRYGVSSEHIYGIRSYKYRKHI